MIKLMQREGVRRAVLLVAFLAFFAGIYFSLRANPGLLDHLQLGPVLFIMLLLVPATMLLNGLEFFLTVLLVGKRISFASALETTIIGSAANMLPLPGSAMVKMTRMRMLGIEYKHGISLTLMMALLWFGASFLYSGVWLFQGKTDSLIAWTVCAVGAGGLLVGVGISVRLYGNAPRMALILLGRFLLIALDALRLLMCLKAMDVAGSYMQTSVLSVSGFLGSAVSLVPAGLGVREAFAAAIGPAVGLAVATAYMISALNRVLGLAVTAPVALLLGLRRERKAGSDA